MSRTKPNSDTDVVRCAVYTRKSTEEGLDQDFNTLDAQREAAEAYIQSQKSEGWTCLPDSYDDGGFSGGNLDRPALKRLMADIEAGKVNCVVVYKVDRLSRSLLDFAKIMETFDRQKIAFVSVTQQFNTSTPMGRLVLNVLLSFAQFEREIIGERIRDKIAAQRRKGKWAGGVPVLGYDVDRSSRSPKLVPNTDEAARVREIFELYLKLGSMLPVLDELESRGWHNKSWTTKKGVVRGGQPFDKSTLYGLLTNAVYIGKIKHKSSLYAGEHKPIVDLDVFQRVQSQLQNNGRHGGALVRNRYGTLLKSLLFCKACGRRMVHTYTDRGPKRYRYYTCSHAINSGRDKCPSGSLPAGEVEQVVVNHVFRVANDADLRAEVVRQAKNHLDEEFAALRNEQKTIQQELKNYHADLKRLSAAGPVSSSAIAADLLERIARCETRLAEIRTRSESLEADHISADDVHRAFDDFPALWATLSPREQAQVLELLIARVEFDVDMGTISISFHAAGIKSLAQPDEEPT